MDQQQPPGRLSRRGLFAGGAAASAGVALGRLPGAAAKPRKRFKRRSDVVIVGAGFAGLAAAREIERKGHSAIVVEARRRVGGRALNAGIGGGEITERGATFVGPTQDRIIGLAAKMGVDIFPTFNEGENMYITSTQRLRYADTGPTGTAPPDPVILPDLARVVSDLNDRSTRVPVDAPWEAEGAAALDAQSLDAYIKENSLTPQFRELVPLATRAIFGAEPAELSLLFTLFYIASSGNEQNVGTFERNFNTRGGAQESRFVGGSQEICFRLAKKLGRSVILNSPVKRITQTRHGVTVHSRRAEITAKQVIVAMPPVLTGKIAYEPGLPSERIELVERLPQGYLTKVTVVYPTPFWREQGLTGQVLATAGPVNATFDDSPEDGSRGVAFGFIGGDSGRDFAKLSTRARRDAVIANFADFFGPQAMEPVKYIESAWKQETYSLGCPVAVAAPGVYTAHGRALRKPVGRIHWAGTETSNYWNGYMDGAVRSGERAAIEVLDLL